MKNFYNNFKNSKSLALLVDPDSYDEKSLEALAYIINQYPPDLLFVGGSLLFNPLEPVIEFLKQKTGRPLYIFPGDITQLSDKADGILFLSLVSGRDPQLLIGNHVIAAPKLKLSGIEVVPTAYMIIENGKSTAVEYMSNTKPIPAEKTDIAVATAIASEMLGMKIIYLEAGSGAAESVGTKMIKAVRQAVSIPVIVGGGIRSAESAEKVYKAGADMIVVGNRVEENPEILQQFVELRNRMNR